MFLNFKHHPGARDPGDTEIFMNFSPSSSMIATHQIFQVVNFRLALIFHLSTPVWASVTPLRFCEPAVSCWAVGLASWQATSYASHLDLMVCRRDVFQAPLLPSPAFLRGIFPSKESAPFALVSFFSPLLCLGEQLAST